MPTFADSDDLPCELSSARKESRWLELTLLCFMRVQTSLPLERSSSAGVLLFLPLFLTPSPRFVLHPLSFASPG